MVDRHFPKRRPFLGTVSTRLIWLRGMVRIKKQSHHNFWLAFTYNRLEQRSIWWLAQITQSCLKTYRTYRTNPFYWKTINPWFIGVYVAFGIKSSTVSQHPRLCFKVVKSIRHSHGDFAKHGPLVKASLGLMPGERVPWPPASLLLGFGANLGVTRCWFSSCFLIEHGRHIRIWEW